MNSFSDNDSDRVQTIREYPYLISEQDIPKNAPKFKSFPTNITPTGKKSKLDLSNPTAKEFRTVLRSWLKSGPNFNSIYSVATWGCGTGCIQLAIINCETGLVIFPSSFNAIDVGHVYYKNASDVISFNLKSRLIVLSGALDEDKSRYGIHYYQLINDKLVLVKFVKLKDSE
jgi:hypothetical protein